MRHNPDAVWLQAQITAACAIEAEACDATGAFPSQAFQALAALGITGRPPLGPGKAESLLWVLAAAGRGDLSVGRILEGHVNALFLIDQFAPPERRDHLRDAATARQLFGVWNTDQPGAPLTKIEGVLQGRKNFCTGIDGLSHAVVTVEGPSGREMIVVPLDDLPVDRSWWRPMGMRASGSHIVDFSGVEVRPEWRLGQPGDYTTQPWFSAGAMRFAAVQVGGMHGVLDLSVDHLKKTGREADPYQRHRLGKMATLVEGGYGWLRRAALSWTRAEHERSSESVGVEAVATVNATRGAVEGSALALLELAERGVGAAGLIAPHPLERRLRDLRTYLRQPNPDGALASFGDAVASGTWEPGMRNDRDLPSP